MSQDGVRTGHASTAPALAVSDGTLEALKWLALLLMTLDHVNKYLLGASPPFHSLRSADWVGGGGH